MPGQGGSRQSEQEKHFNRWKQQRQSDEFWSKASGKPKNGESESKEQFKQQVFDEFDEFFDFKRQEAESSVSRDDTKGADYKIEVEVDFMQAVLGAKVKV